MTEEENDRLALILGAFDENVAHNAAELSDWEQGFLTDTAERAKTYGDRIRVSEKQWNILDRCAEKLGVAK